MIRSTSFFFLLTALTACGHTNTPLMSTTTYADGTLASNPIGARQIPNAQPRQAPQYRDVSYQGDADLERATLFSQMGNIANYSEANPIPSFRGRNLHAHIDAVEARTSKISKAYEGLINKDHPDIMFMLLAISGDTWHSAANHFETLPSNSNAEEHRVMSGAAAYCQAYSRFYLALLVADGRPEVMQTKLFRLIASEVEQAGLENVAVCVNLQHQVTPDFPTYDSNRIRRVLYH